MYIIVGLGNPESKYNGTRHNIGFSAITALADANNISLDMKKHKALCGKGVVARSKGAFGRTIDLYEPEWGKCQRVG